MSTPTSSGETPAASGGPAAATTGTTMTPGATARATRPPRHISIIIAGLFAVSMMKGLRMPNLWSTTHMTFNYSQGFIRRGLFGEMLRLAGSAKVYRYNFLALLAVILFVLAAAAMIRLIRRTLATDGGDRGLQAATLVFAASPGIVFLAHELGYLDYVGLIAVPLFIAWAARTRTLWLIFYVAAAISVVLALIHESMIVMFAPTLLFVMVSHIVSQTRARSLRRQTFWLLVAHTVLATAIALVASSVVGTLGTKRPTRIYALQASIARVANFPLRDDGFAALYRPVHDNLKNLMPWYWAYPMNRRYLLTSLAVAFPGLAVLSVYAVRLIARLSLPLRTRAVVTALFLAATFSPLLLNLVGWDSARWNAICFVASFSCIACLRLFFSTNLPDVDRHQQRVDEPAMLTLAAAAIVFGLTTNYVNFLFDGYVVQWFPFDGQLRALLELFQGNFTFMPGA